MKDRFEQLEKYRPDTVKYLFIGEAHPCTDGQFFYYEDVPKQDNLFLYLIRSVFPDLNEWDAKKIRAEKPALLHRFKEEGYFIDFGVNGDIPKGTSAGNKNKIIASAQDDLIARVEKYKSCGIILLTASIFKAHYQRFVDEGFTVLNNTAIPYPGSGQQGKFKEAMIKIGF